MHTPHGRGPRARRPFLVSALVTTLVTAATAFAVVGCTTAETPAPDPATASAETPAGEQARAVLAGHGLDGLDAVDVVERLEALPVAERPGDLRVSVRPDVLLVSGADGQESPLPVPDDRFYLSVAPYTDTTHDCYHHSLTTCVGELGDQEVSVTVVDDASGEVLVEKTTRTNDNGFVGIWLPRDVEATLTVTGAAGTATTPVATGPDDPTCLTTLRLV